MDAKNFPNCDFVSWDKPTRERCSKCGNILYEKNIKGEKKLVCLNKDCK